MAGNIFADGFLPTRAPLTAQLCNHTELSRTGFMSRPTHGNRTLTPLTGPLDSLSNPLPLDSLYERD